MTFFVVPIMLLAGAASAQSGARADAMNAQTKVPPVDYRSAFQGYRRFADEDLRDWRKSNAEVGMAGGQISKPQPGTPAGASGPAEKPSASPHQRHGGHQ